MTVLLEKGQRLQDALPESRQKTGAKKLNAVKYLGALKLEEDPLEMQKRMRDEWE